MRALYIVRGIPGSGKSTWVRENGYDPITVSPDAIRLAESGIDFDIEGKPFVSQRYDKLVWQRVRKLIETRMQKGLTTILDSTMVDMRNASPFRKLAEFYHYRVYVVDFTDVAIETCLEQNLQRPVYKRVPEYVIYRMFSRLRRSSVPSSIPVLTPEQAKQQLDAPTPLNADKYQAINYIGDIHGCYTALIGLLSKLGGAAQNDYLNDGELYVFLGDYLDRGLENAEVLSYLMRIASRPNVKLLEGNHERALATWANRAESAKASFADTRTELEQAGIEPKQVRQFVRRLGQFSYCVFRGQKIFACHGGISNIPKPFAYVSTNDFVIGFGAYQDIDAVEDAWEQYSAENGDVLVHGHRSNESSEAHPFTRVYNLEGAVECGGELRCVRFENAATQQPTACVARVYTEDNHVFRAAPEVVDFDEETDMARIIDALRANSCILEKSFGTISSFNFSSRAFLKKIWDSQTIRARGLFIDTETNEVKARSYDKFFNLEERPETKLSELKRTLCFPVDIYLKENGYLGICASDGSGGLIAASKSSLTGEHAQRFGKRLETLLGEKHAAFSEYLQANNLSAVFEVIEPEDNPHIVEYDKPRLVLLALVRNTMRFEQLPYLEMCETADRFGFEHKRLLGAVKNFNEFCTWVNQLEDEDWTLDGMPIEGVVAEDSAGFMVKIKGAWYRKWKGVRGMLKDIAKRGHSSKVEKLGKYYRDADSIYKAAIEYVALCPKGETEGNGLCPPPKSENVIAFRNWYEQEYLPAH